ncbi:SMP-30/gluconolactonase/LRE family protein [Leifsonia sp. 22587]|uniref:SMP-30/gluconolactonase/LRE family protein n=1 Tax=Leifsonia sp. 22587 TaxID=3453946 RepID=UPI003F86FC7F
MEILASGLRVPEGPALTRDGLILFTEQTAGRVSALTPAGVEEFAYVGGAPNSCTPGARDEVYVCQNGGVVGAWRSSDPRTPSMQVIKADGVETVAASVSGNPLWAPNDLAFGPDGRLYFTDPAQPFDPERRLDRGYLYALGAVNERVAEVGGVYCNGIGFSPQGELIWVESYTRAVRAIRDGRPVTLCILPDGHVPDGFAVAADGRIFVASCGSHGISVVSPEGEYLGLILLDRQANPTNCCFLGDTLIVTDFGMTFETDPVAGRLWQVAVDATAGPMWTGSVA